VIAGLFPFIKIPGIGFDPFIRGWLVVAVGVLVLMGSVYFLLATNTGMRTGGLISLAALFGWLSIMGTMWWIYGGTGLQGTLPHWTVKEVNRGQLASAQFEKARQLGTALDQTVKDPTQMQAYFEQEEATAATSKTPTLNKVGGWRPVLLANPARGDAQATVDAFLIGSKEFASNQEYLPLGAFDIGGKDKRPVTDVCPTHNPFRIVTTQTCWRRAGDKLHSIFVQPKHPAHYAAVLVQPADPRTLVSRPGQAPPTKVPDPNQPVITVILERDLGSVRLPPAMIALGSLVLFVSSVAALHRRDKEVARNRSLVPATARG
jgi:hypothetical protein